MSEAPGEPDPTARAASIDGRLGALAARWVALVGRRSGVVIALYLTATLALGLYAAATLGINSSEMEIFSSELPVMAERAAYLEAFPELRDPVVVVVDAATPDLASDSARRLAARLRAEPALFPSVFEPEGGPFFERHGLLFLDTDALYDLGDRLAQAQPVLAELSRDQSVAGFFRLLTRANQGDGLGAGEAVLADVFDATADAVDGALAGRGTPLSWQTLLEGRDSDAPGEGHHRLLLVRVAVDFARVRPAEAALQALDGALAELGLDAHPNVRVRATGTFPLAYEEARHIGEQATWAGLASLVLVTGILLLGLGAARLVLCSVAALLAGLVWTAAVAAAAIGHLHLISAAFGVLFIGLSIDFAIHLCVAFGEGRRTDASAAQAFDTAARRIGGALVVCAVTTAVAFFAFVPTDFTGVGELGVIGGTGMFVGLVTNFTLLPALVLRYAADARPRPGRALPVWATALLAVPVRHAGAVLVAALLLAALALWRLPALDFDTNPIRVRDPAASSVQAFSDILAQGDAYPWNLSAIADDPGAARRLAATLEALPEVRHAHTLDDFVPADQETKLEILRDTAFLVRPSLVAEPDVTRTSPADAQTALVALLPALRARVGASGEVADAAARLRDSLETLRERLRDDFAAAATLDAVRSALFDSLPGRLRQLRVGLEPNPVDLAALPDALTRRMVSLDSRVRVEAFPARDLNDPGALDTYVAAVRGAAPGAYGEGLFIVETGAVVLRSLVQALAWAGAVLLLLLAFVWRNVWDTALVALPLLLATLLTVAGAGLFGIPFNFANVIVVPLLLGMGIDSGIHMVHRVRAGALPAGNLLQTGTTRAVLLSALTTTASFGTLGVSSHLGIASLGQLLTLGMAMVLFCNLVVLPAAVTWARALRDGR